MTDLLSGKLKTDYQDFCRGQFELGHYANGDDVSNAISAQKTVILEGNRSWWYRFHLIAGLVASIIGIFCYIFGPYARLDTTFLFIGLTIVFYVLIRLLANFRKKYLLIFNNEGLYYRSPFVEEKLIPWDEISNLTKKTISSNHANGYRLLILTLQTGYVLKIKMREFKNNEFDSIEFKDLPADFAVGYWQAAKA